MAEKLKDVPEENLMAPKPSMAAPAMQQLGFSLDEPDLKEMYLDLLATASDNRRKDQAHPSFVEVIKQLSSRETGLLNYILRDPNPQAIASFHRVTDGGGEDKLAETCAASSQRQHERADGNPELATFVDNWIHLGLVEVSYTEHLTPDTAAPLAAMATQAA